MDSAWLSRMGSHASVFAATVHAEGFSVIMSSGLQQGPSVIRPRFSGSRIGCGHSRFVSPVLPSRLDFLGSACREPETHGCDMGGIPALPADAEDYVHSWTGCRVA